MHAEIAGVLGEPLLERLLSGSQAHAAAGSTRCDAAAAYVEELGVSPGSLGRRGVARQNCATTLKKGLSKGSNRVIEPGSAPARSSLATTHATLETTLADLDPDEPVGLERREQLAVPERLARRGEPDLARRLVDEVMRGERLDQPGLQVGALAVRGDPDRVEAAAPDDDVDRALHARRFSRGGRPGCIESAISASTCRCSSGGSGLIFSW